MTDPIRAWARQYPTDTALVAGSETLDAAALDRAVDAFIESDPRFRTGARLAVNKPNAKALIVAFWAAWRSGALLAPLNPRWPESATREAADRIGAVFMGDPATDARPASALNGVVAVHTSGSSGPPRAAVLSERALRASADGAIHRLDLRRGDAWLLTLPLCHVGGLAVLVRAALARAAVHLPERPGPPEEGTTHVSMVSTQLWRLVQDGAAPPASLRCVLLGGSAFSAALLRDAKRAGWPIATSYGLTEMGSLVTSTDPGGPEDALGTSGRVLSGRELRVSATGRISVRGDARFEGYLSTQGLDRPFDADGWFDTGDLGTLDAEGRLTVTGRADARFISGGENVQPEAIEKALVNVDGVEAALVVPVPDAEFGARPFAFVRSPHSARYLEAQLRKHLPGYMIPVAWADLDEAASGGIKPRRSELARVAAERHASRDA